jgi:hypothetical protein
MKIQLHKSNPFVFQGALALTAIVLIVIFLTAQNSARVTATGPTDLSQAPAVSAQPASALSVINKPVEQYTPQERQMYQITESYDPLPVAWATLSEMQTFSTGPDISAMDIRLREQCQITEAYPFSRLILLQWV